MRLRFWRASEAAIRYACGCEQTFASMDELHEHMANTCLNRGRYICSRYAAREPHGEHFVVPGVECPGYPEVT